ncbi:MAG: family 43 glycosylhydrolase [Bacteroidota bacterium]|nr:family 43 glycosylhydrolase [Bacteroidota bacterium]
MAQQSVSVVKDKDEVAYLFAYFTGNSNQDESIHFAVSRDGYHYYALNNNQPVLDSRVISSTGGVRDPHILRGADGHTFYMVATDMVCSKGWDSNRAMVLMKSTDLINWKTSVVNIQQRFPGNEDLKRVWAPQTIYDPAAGKYMVYWSMQHGSGPDILYYAYANADFSDLESTPQPLFIPQNKQTCIDPDIVFKDSVYHLFYKTQSEGGSGIKMATSASLTSGQWQEGTRYLQQTNEAVEGAGVFKLNQSDEYILMYDIYGKGSYQFTKTSDFDRFKVIDEQVTMDFHPRHGTVMPITRNELNALLSRWGKPAAFAGAPNNPVLEGYYADPEVLYSNKTHKYYIYPTSDGFTNWAGYYFKTFSSTDLKTWKDEGIILDLKKDVSWANRNAWAPCIIEKKSGRKYHYYFYFSAAQKIGVAVSDNPTGPFKDSGKALIDQKPEGVRGGQQIDQDVFEDPKTGKNYLYWGNGYMAVAELNKDMVSIRPNTTRIITPDKTFREGSYVFFRKGIYYFLWSEDDTRSENYRVRYGTSKSPVGPIIVPEHNLVIAKDTAKGIYGTGHNSILQVPGKDEWYIVYHRFNRPYGIKMGDAAGYNREVCIDKLEFNEDGTIKQVVPTL